MATGFDAVLRSKAKPWAKFVALDALEYIKADIVGSRPEQAGEGRGAEGQAQLFDALAAQIEAAAGATAAAERG
eukprot:12942033-Alexandrium_andersonii.AAC.1